MTIFAHVNPPKLDGHTERVPIVLSFSLDRFGGGRSVLSNGQLVDAILLVLECFNILFMMVILMQKGSEKKYIEKEQEPQPFSRRTSGASAW
jgi:hypothetical protein